jgi:hypothetical protein
MTTGEVRSFAADWPDSVWMAEEMSAQSGRAPFFVADSAHPVDLVMGHVFSSLDQALAFVGSNHERDVAEQRSFIDRLRRHEGYLASWPIANAELTRLDTNLSFDAAGPHFSAIGIDIPPGSLATLRDHLDVRYVWDAGQMGPRPHGVDPLTGEWR